MSRFRALLAVACILVSMCIPGPAMAACLSPVDSTTTTCNGSGGSNICSKTGGIWTCDMDLSGNGTDAEGYVVLDTAGDWCDAGTYCAFGTDATGDGFCCEIEPDSISLGLITRVDLLGSDADDDTLAFQYFDGTFYHELENGASSALFGVIDGEGGNDTIDGSNFWDGTSFLYDEELDGNAGDDVIDGWGGNDAIIGYSGFDFLFGGADADNISAGVNRDIVLGGTGNDTLFGETGDDDINGQGGGDDIWGSFEDDLLCGGADGITRDELYGGQNDDTLWGATTYDYEAGGADGSAPGDYCSRVGGDDGLCEFTLGSAPACP